MRWKTGYIFWVIFSKTINCQFEFSDEDAVYKIVTTTLNKRHSKCATLLRPTVEDHRQKSTIDRLMWRFLKQNISNKVSIMSYNLEDYDKVYMDPNYRANDNCVYWLTVILASNSTNQQLVYLSQKHSFTQSFYGVFANRTDIFQLTRNVKIKLNGQFWMVQPYTEGQFLIQSFMNSTNIKNHYLTNETTTELIRNTTNDSTKLKGRTLRIGTIQVPFFVRAIRLRSTGLVTSISGYYRNIWKNLENILQFSSVYSESLTFGTYDKNGNWTGLYGKISRGEIDAILESMAISLSRYNVVDFLHPMERAMYKVMYKRDVEFFDYLKAFRPLSLEIWLALIIWIIAGGFVYYFANRFRNKFLQQEEHSSSLISSLYFFIRALSCQGPDFEPNLWSFRIFFLTVYLFAVVILTSYSASLISVLTFKTQVEPFKELADITATDFQLVTLANTVDYDLFAKAVDPVYKRIYEKSVVKDMEIVGSHYSALSYTCKTRKAVLFIQATGYAMAALREVCGLIPLKTDISPVYRTISISKNSEYRPLLMRSQLRLLEAGIINRYRKMYKPLELDPPEKEISITLNDVGGVFIFFAVFQLLALVIFFYECLSRKCRRQSSQLYKN